MNNLSLTNAMLQARCPACRQGDTFQTFMTMHKSCSVCGTVYEREHGFFLMSVFVGYIINGILFAPLALYGYFSGNLVPASIAIGIGIILLFAPTFRYSRILWLYIDQMLDPRRDSSISIQHSSFTQ